METQVGGNTLIIRKQGTQEENIQLDYNAVKEASVILKAINHKLRQAIIKMLEEHERMTVTEIFVKLRLEQSVTSQHLSILRKAGVIKFKRDGKFIIYSLNHERIAAIAKFVNNLLEGHVPATK